MLAHKVMAGQCQCEDCPVQLLVCKISLSLYYIISVEIAFEHVISVNLQRTEAYNTCEQGLGI